MEEGWRRGGGGVRGKREEGWRREEVEEEEVGIRERRSI